MPDIELEAVVTGSRPMEAYGGVRIGDEALKQIAARIRSGEAPMIFEHDPRRPVGATILNAGVRETQDGFKEVWVRFRVDADAWAEYQSQLALQGAPGGFSFSASEPLATLEGPESAHSIELAADAHHWTDDELLAAAAELQRVVTTNVARRYAFAFYPDPVVVVQLAVDLWVNLLGNGLYDALRHFIRPHKPTIFEFRFERTRESASLTARVETDDADVLKDALNAMTQVASTSGVAFYDPEAGTWEPQGLPPGDHRRTRTTD